MVKSGVIVVLSPVILSRGSGRQEARVWRAGEPSRATQPRRYRAVQPSPLIAAAPLRVTLLPKAPARQRVGIFAAVTVTVLLSVAILYPATRMAVCRYVLLPYMLRLQCAALRAPAPPLHGYLCCRERYAFIAAGIKKARQRQAARYSGTYGAMRDMARMHARIAACSKQAGRCASAPHIATHCSAASERHARPPAPAP